MWNIPTGSLPEILEKILKILPIIKGNCKLQIANSAGSCQDVPLKLDRQSLDIKEAPQLFGTNLFTCRKSRTSAASHVTCHFRFRFTSGQLPVSVRATNEKLNQFRCGDDVENAAIGDRLRLQRRRRRYRRRQAPAPSPMLGCFSHFLFVPPWKWDPWAGSCGMRDSRGILSGFLEILMEFCHSIGIGGNYKNQLR